METQAVHFQTLATRFPQEARAVEDHQSEIQSRRPAQSVLAAQAAAELVVPLPVAVARSRLAAVVVVAAGESQSSLAVPVFSMSHSRAIFAAAPTEAGVFGRSAPARLVAVLADRRSKTHAKSLGAGLASANGNVSPRRSPDYWSESARRLVSMWLSTRCFAPWRRVSPA